jgi:hypothetical protein
MCQDIGKGILRYDLLKSVPRSQSAVDLLQEQCSILEKGGIHLHKITTNCPYVRAMACSMAQAKKDTSNNRNPTIERALVVKWDSETDQFIFMLAHLKKIEPPTTRRECLSLLYSVFDPMGFIAPYLLRSKKANAYALFS